jgi:hypothetical protein
MLNRALEEALDGMGQMSIYTGAINELLPFHAPPMTPAVDQSSMSMGSTVSSIKFQGSNSMHLSGNGRSFFSPGDSDVDMSLS